VAKEEDVVVSGGEEEEEERFNPDSAAAAGFVSFDFEPKEMLLLVLPLLDFKLPFAAAAGLTSTGALAVADAGADVVGIEEAACSTVESGDFFFFWSTSSSAVAVDGGGLDTCSVC
jgi:hypothetical protein